MGRTLVAVDLGGSGIRAAQFTIKKGVPSIKKTGYIALPDGAIEGGEVKDVEAVGDALKALWSQAKFSTKQVVFGVANASVLVRMKTLDWDTDEDFRRALKYQPGVAEDLSFDVDKANLDYHTLDEHMLEAPDGTQKKVKSILLVAAEKTMVDTFVSTLRHAGLRPVAADLTPFALIRSVAPLPPSETPGENVEVIIDMGLDVSTVILHQQGQPRFVRIVTNQAGRHLTTVLSEHFTWSPEDAERTKVELGLKGGVSVDGSQHPAQQVINHIVSAFINEARATIDYFLNNTPQVNEVSRIVLSGGGTRIKGFAERLASELRVPVEYATPSTVVTHGKGIALPDGVDDDSQMAVVYGLASGMV